VFSSSIDETLSWQGAGYHPIYELKYTIVKKPDF
jgi:hypothetical protein